MVLLIFCRNPTGPHDLFEPKIILPGSRTHPFGGCEAVASVSRFISALRRSHKRRRNAVKKLILQVAILTMGLTTAAPAVAQMEPANGVQGFITSISGAVVLVEEVPSDEWGSDKGAFTVTEETAILRQQGDELVPGTFDDLQAGQHVAATYAGPVAESYPTQGTAGSIVVLESPGEDLGGGTPGILTEDL